MKNKIILLTGVIFAVFLTIDQARSATDPADYKNGEKIFITAARLEAKLSDKNLVLLDCNHPKRYAKGHIPGAVNIGFKGLSNIVGKPGDRGWGTLVKKSDLKQKLGSLGISNDTFVVVYSNIFKGPGAGGRTLWQLKMAGFENARLLYGGMQAWKDAGFKLIKKAAKPQSVEGPALKGYDATYSAPLEFVKGNLGKLVLIDVRSKKEYSGKDTSRGESRGGHIKGAIWLEWTQLLNKDATPKSAEKIMQIMAGIGVRPEDDFVLY